MSDIRFNQWLHQSGTGGVSQDHIGNIGIGTTNPSIVVSAANTAVLNVGVITANNLFVNNAFNGDITGNVTGNISGATGTFSGNVDIADKIIHTGDTDTAMRFPADNTFAVDTAGTERIRITSDGNIGIGNTNPGDFRAGAENLVVGSGSGAEGMTIYSATNASGRICFADGSGASDEERGVIQYAHDDNHMQFDTNAVERVRITSTGLVGVNCTPLSQFQVKSGTNQNIALSSMSSEASIEAYNDAGSANVPLRLRASAHKFFIGSTEGLRVHTNGLIGVGHDSPTAHGRMTVAMPSQSGGAAIQVANSSLGSGDGTTSNIVLRSVNNNAAHWADAEYRASAHIFTNQAAERFRVHSNGNIGISSAIPSRRLDINGGSAGIRNNSCLLYFAKTGNNYGTDYPHRNSYIGRVDSAGAHITGQDGGYGSSANQMVIGHNGSGGILFGTTDAGPYPSGRMRIDADGRITTPNQVSFFQRDMNGAEYNNGILKGGSNDHNIGGHYDTSTGIFTAPIAGVYMFGCSVLVNSGSGRLEGSIYKNNSVQLVNFNGTGTTYDGPSATCIVSLAANDNIRVRRHSGTAYAQSHSQHCFWGRLMG